MPTDCHTRAARRFSQGVNYQCVLIHLRRYSDTAIRRYSDTLIRQPRAYDSLTSFVFVPPGILIHCQSTVWPWVASRSQEGSVLFLGSGPRPRAHQSSITRAHHGEAGRAASRRWVRRGGEGEETNKEAARVLDSRSCLGILVKRGCQLQLTIVGSRTEYG